MDTSLDLIGMVIRTFWRGVLFGQFQNAFGVDARFPSRTFLVLIVNVWPGAVFCLFGYIFLDGCRLWSLSLKKLHYHLVRSAFFSWQFFQHCVQLLLSGVSQ